MRKNRKSQKIEKNLKSVSNQGWFSPSQPIDAVAQAQAFGRQFAYQVGSNLQYTPRSGEDITAKDLRGLAESLDILRAVIETRKDQICIIEYDFVMKDGSDGDKRCKDLKEFFKYPDKENDWHTWLRMLMDDLLVIDAPTIYINRTIGGDVYSLDIVDGSAIKVLIDDKGRSPNPPDAAYQAVFYGVPAVDYTKDELIYRPRNKRSYKLYGYSPVEQIVMTVNIALKRQLSQLQYYTEGNIPSAIMSTPENWTPENIAQFQEYWDSILEGNTAKRRHAIFVPHSMSYNPTRENPITDQFDEWLARIVCYVFSVSPQAFAKQVNRATAEVNKQTADEEGIIPIKIWVKSLIDYIIHRVFGYDDIEFSWNVEQNVDPEKQAQIDDINIKNGSATIDEVRESRGLDPLPKDEQLPQPKITITEQAQASTQEVKPADNTEEVQKYKKDDLESEIQSYFDTMSDDVIEQIIDSKSDNVDEILSNLNFIGYAQLLNTIKANTVKAYFNQYMKEQENTKDPQPISRDEVKKAAKEYANKRAADLVTKLDETTRKFLKADIENAIENNLTPEDLAKELETNYAFSPQRAKTISEYELGQAKTQALLSVGQHNPNVIGKRYVSVRKAKTHICDECDSAVKMGTVPLSDNFSGIGDAPAHPNCVHEIELVMRGE